jgi:AbrB family looped-hinge helix DNA binding protein
MSTISMVALGDKGRVVVPKSIRDEIGLEEGDRFAIFVDELGRVILETPAAVKARIRRRASRGNDLDGSAVHGNAVDQLLEERRRDSSLLESEPDSSR